ncbi:MAG: LysM peptidoglycan-binding domain-containing protein [Clostridia bacterium]|nr:LysM peptidoglycan-binding domain-containing protein [Clostridia bacterium]
MRWIMIVYKVNKEDSIEQIAAMFLVNAADILRINKAKSVISGMRLLIPEYLGTPYTVQPYDTMEKIAAKFDVNLEELKQLNKIEKVFLGQRIFIP